MSPNPDLRAFTYERVSILDGLDVVESNGEWLWRCWDNAVCSFRPAVHDLGSHQALAEHPMSTLVLLPRRELVGEIR